MSVSANERLVVVGPTDWQADAEELAASGIPFTLAGFGYSFHRAFYDRMKTEFNLNARFSVEQGKAWFWPEARNSLPPTAFADLGKVHPAAP